METPEPGLYEDIKPDVYFAWDAESNSHLKPMRQSPLHYKEQRPWTTLATQFGTLAHAVMLEPVELLDRNVVLPDYESDLADKYKRPKLTNEYKELVSQFTAANKGKTVVTPSEWATIKAMHYAVMHNGSACQWLQGPGKTEVSIVWDDASGIRCKARPDKISGNFLVDYKTTKDAANFEKEIFRYGYHRQAAMYLDGMRAVTDQDWTFVIACQEKTPPYCCRAAIVGKDTIEMGRMQYKADLLMVKHCRETDHWPGYDNPDEWNLPAWAMVPTEDIAVSFGGLESVQLESEETIF